MPKTPRAISLIGISLTILALATGSWLSTANALEITVDWPTDIAVEVQDDFAQGASARPSAPDGDCAETDEIWT